MERDLKLLLFRYMAEPWSRKCPYRGKARERKKQTEKDRGIRIETEVRLTEGPTDRQTEGPRDRQRKT